VPIHFICPHCAAATDVDEKYSGQVGPCAHCGKPITIPTPGVFVPAPSSGVGTRVIFVVTAALVIAAAVVVMRGCWGFPRGANARDAECVALCTSNLQRIALAMREYEAAQGSFPPAYVVDKQGKPLYSWRVLLLPYLDQQDLYDQFRLDEPWNSENNHHVSDLAVDLFQCPGQPETKLPTTNYMMVVGGHTISAGREPRKITEIIDGLTDTIMLVEVADSLVYWAQPEDLHFDKLRFTVNGSKRREISSYHRSGANVAFCDGSVRLLKKSINPQLVKAMLTIDGGEPIEKSD
jgi:prepilin-type processing-associated H-X9-DG protein